MASSELLNMIDNWADAHLTSSELVEEIINKAEEEKLSKPELRQLVESALHRRELSDRQVQKAIPAELKNPVKRAAGLTPKPRQLPAALSAAQITTKASDNEEITPDTRKYSEDSTPEPLARDPTPEHPQPTDEPEESYKGDAGNNPELIAKYVSDSAQPLVIHIEVPKFFGQLFAANRNNTGAYLYIKDMEVYKVEADNVHKVEVKSK